MEFRHECGQFLCECEGLVVVSVQCKGGKQRRKREGREHTRAPGRGGGGGGGGRFEVAIVEEMIMTGMLQQQQRGSFVGESKRSHQWVHLHQLVMLHASVFTDLHQLVMLHASVAATATSDERVGGEIYGVALLHTCEMNADRIGMERLQQQQQKRRETTQSYPCPFFSLGTRWRCT